MPGIADPHLILGGPGCGKTTRLLQIVKQKLAAGVRSEAIAFVSFTKEAVREAKARASEEFGLDPDHDLPWFRTIHSLTYARLGLSREEVMGRRDWLVFAELVGEELSSVAPEAEAVPTGTDGDKMIRVVDFAATTMRPVVEAWHDLGEVIDWSRMDRFARTLARYKEDTGKLDFNDMLARYVETGDPVPVRVAVIDEAQDLTRAQWAVVRRAFHSVEEVYVGGDDDQAIYRWAGADVDTFLALSSDPEVLPVSHRLPTRVFHFADHLASRISRRYRKQFSPTTRRGSVEVHSALDYVDLSVGSWLLLARNGYQLRKYESMARDHGYTYAIRKGASVDAGEVAAMKLWERLRTGRQGEMTPDEVRGLCKAMDLPVPQLRETARYPLGLLPEAEAARGRPWYDVLIGIPAPRRDYYLNVLRRGADRLSAEKPRIRIDTIHGVKGAEADHVLVSPDMSERTMRGYLMDPDAEHRVFYVAVTRAMDSLHLLLPTGFNHYQWPHAGD